MQDLLYINWSPDPSIFGLPVRWYGLLFASSFFFGYILVNRMFRKENIPDHWLESLTIYMAIGTVLGARLGHCFFYDPEYYLSHPLEILQIWKGGLASHGAAIGIITSLFLWSRRVSKRNIVWILDRVAIVVALSGLLIRSGNLMNSEILGQPTEKSWGFVFPLADQAGSSLQARWKKDRVELKFSPNAVNFPRSFSVFRTYDDHNFVELPGRFVLPPGATNGGKILDQTVEEKPNIVYLLTSTRSPIQEMAQGQDSSDTRKATLIQRYDPKAASFTGQWEGDQVHLKLKVIGLNPKASLPAYLFRSYQGEQAHNWTMIHRGILSGASDVAIIDTVDTPDPGKAPTYLLVIKRTEAQLIARHPAQLYEALAYTLIFILLLFLYKRQDGKIPYGQLFGIFMILIFGFRFFVEFLKEGFIPELEGAPLNMGQMLSIPFVLIGIGMLIWSLKKGYTEPPEIPASEYERLDKKS